MCYYLLEPLRVRKRDVGEGLLALHVVPGCPDVVVPRDHPLHRVPHEVHVYGLGETEAVTSTSQSLITVPYINTTMTHCSLTVQQCVAKIHNTQAFCLAKTVVN